ncbi:hypothetical protein L208DRAFT_1304925, partial [Tricholoma matsutake]
FCCNLHQCPQTPLNNEQFMHLTSQEIYHGAIKDMYDFCYWNDLAQVGAYLWNQWYTTNQWKLWAQSANTAIHTLKTTMVVESLWHNIKHRHLHEFNCPQLDLVAHVIILDVLPWVQRTLEYVQGLRWVGWPKELAGWKTDFSTDWMDMARSDEHWLVEKELKWLKAHKKTKDVMSDWLRLLKKRIDLMADILLRLIIGIAAALCTSLANSCCANTWLERQTISSTISHTVN